MAHSAANTNGNSSLVSRNITVQGRRTSVRLEPEMWLSLEEIARRENCSINALGSLIDQRRKAQTSLTAAIRVFVVLYFRAAATDDGHSRAGHGDFNSMLYSAGLAQHVQPAGDQPRPISRNF